MRYQGKITQWNEAKGFGFVTPNGRNQPVFVHIRAFSNRQRRPRENAVISYALGTDVKGRCCAVSVRYADEKPATVALRVSVFPMVWVMLFAALLSGAVLAGTMPVIVSIIYLVLSLVTFLAYALDKSAAEAGRWRTQESTLHLFGLAGGWPGALFAQQLLRHKSSKREFQTAFWFTVMLNCAALVWLALPYGADVRLLLSQMI
ncbi:MAG TPA: cold shock and DUF1294 domain-containing protein [Thiobacillus sp.]|nr:cold shock and DUF1294 domain-containing protein [Thiobacillus sp.]